MATCCCIKICLIDEEDVNLLAIHMRTTHCNSFLNTHSLLVSISVIIYMIHDQTKFNRVNSRITIAERYCFCLHSFFTLSGIVSPMWEDCCSCFILWVISIGKYLLHSRENKWWPYANVVAQLIGFFTSNSSLVTFILSSFSRSEKKNNTSTRSINKNLDMLNIGYFLDPWHRYCAVLDRNIPDQFSTRWYYWHGIQHGWEKPYLFVQFSAFPT